MPKRSTVPADAAQRVLRLRVKHGLTQTQLAERMGVSSVTVSRWEIGQSKPSRLAWQQILRAETYGLDGLDRRFHPPTAVREANVEYVTSKSTCPTPDFTADPDAVRLVVEAHRLRSGHLFNPVFATEISRVDPLPHQRIAVYEYMLTQPRLRFLLADDAGAGKTIMSGLYIREMLNRRLIRRVLIVPPAGLVGNWQREMKNLFSLDFRVVSGGEAKTGNPFRSPDGDFLISSIDTLASERMFARLKEDEVAPYDLVIFDEAHKLSARRDPDGTFRATDRYRLAEAVAGAQGDLPRWRLKWSARHLLLLTATPHMGKDFPYFCLWRLLEPEALSTFDAFQAYPKDARRKHFLRRTKEEMVRYDGSRIYPERISDTLSYDLTQGEVSEQALYDATTGYIETYYNMAKLLNRTAAYLAMSVFQRRLASSTFALLRSFERRIEKVERLIDDISSGRITPEQLQAQQKRLDLVEDVYFGKTADEEEAEGGLEENEVAEAAYMAGTVASNIADLVVEKGKLEELRTLANKVYALGAESKFEKLREVLTDSRYRDEKFIIFTEHRDTLEFLVRRLEGLGYTGQVARIHGGMDYLERDEQVEFFRRRAEDGGARYLIATDAAGEGINLQFCWIMINYDIPWNPARLEQRMGRIHRYGQKHDPVIIVNLVAGKTREGRVLKVLLEKLENIRRQLGSDKVFDSVGRLFEDISIRDYMEMAVTEDGAARAEKAISGRLTPMQIKAIEDRERAIYGEGGDVGKELDRLTSIREKEAYCHLLPGYVRQFLLKACPRIGIGIEGDLDGVFTFKAEKSGAMDRLWPVMEHYPQDRQNRLSLTRLQPGRQAQRDDEQPSVFLRPGEPLFDAICDLVCDRFGTDALTGGIFADPSAQDPYFFHLAVVEVVRKADPHLRPLAHAETLEHRLVGIKQAKQGAFENCPLERLLLLQPRPRLPPSAILFASTIKDALEQATQYVKETLAAGYAADHRQTLLKSLPERESFLRRGFDYQEAELAARRMDLARKAGDGDARAAGELTKVKDRQKIVSELRDEALAALHREPELIEVGRIQFLAHALIVPSGDPEDKKRQDDAIEEIAVKVAKAFEESGGAKVTDVSTASLARAAGLYDWPGFDLLSSHPTHGEKAIEVKGRAAVGQIEVSENEWAKACNLRERYWLYVVYDCASPSPRLVRVQDPFGKLIVKARGGVRIEPQEIMAAGEG